MSKECSLISPSLCFGDSSSKWRGNNGLVVITLKSRMRPSSDGLFLFNQKGSPGGGECRMMSELSSPPGE